MDKGNPKTRAQAVPFILINEKVDQGRVTYEFELQRKAVEVFASIKNKRIAIATVAGPQRSGKSFLSNRLLKRMTGFAIGPSTMPCTKGLWIWGEPIQINEDTVLVIMDTEGLNSVQRDANVDLKIFSLSVLLSSVFIYNSLGHIDEKALENMSYVLRVSQNIRMRSENEADSDMAQCFPLFYWVLRDFSLDLKGMSQSEYLENALKPISNEEKDPKNQIRSQIRKLFTHRRCECFPRPINDEDRLAHIEDLRYEDLREKFRDKMQQFQRGFFENLPVKTIGGKALTGDLYLNLVREYVDAINGGRVPEVLTSLERVLESEARQVTEGLMNSYKEAMNNLIGSKALDESVIEKNHRDFVRKIQDKLDDKLKGWLDVGRTGQYKNKMLQALQKDFKERLKRNAVLCDKLCQTEFQKFSSAFYELPQMKNDLVAESYFKEKYNEFAKRIQQYINNCKAPRKYTFFIEKFPKATFDFFDLCFARARGVFNNEMNKLRAEVRNLQAEMESSGRINIEQQTLLSEKQKQIEALGYERDLLRRQHEKNQKMKELEEQTEKMGKNQLKKTLENYKAQLIDYENTNADLEAQLLKIRTELSTKKIEISQMTKKTSSQPSESTNAETGLPNELISVLSGIKDKLTVMREFYEKSVSDESFEESMLRQIEQQRTQKHAEVERVREKMSQKMIEMREKFSKNQNDYEKNIRLINSHVDDLKTQNMDMQTTIAQLQDRKGNNLQAQRKSLEESLRLKTNNINAFKLLVVEKDQKIQSLEFRVANINSQLANLESYRQTFPFILTESINWLLKKQNKLKHSIKTLSSEDQDIVRKIFKDQNLNPF